jgi:hypothetical protein
MIPSRTRSVLLASTLGVFVVTTLGAFLSEHLWAQSVWSDSGQRRYLISAGTALLLGILLGRMRSAVLLLVAACAALVYTMLAVGAAAALGAVCWLCGAWCLGRITLRVLGLRSDSQSLPGVLLELPAGLALVSWSVGVTAALPVHWRWLHMAWPILAIVAEARSLRVPAPAWREALRRRSSLVTYIAALPVAFLGFAHWQAALMPEASTDGLAMHLNAAAWMAGHGSFHFDVSRAVWAVMPMAGDWVFASAYLAGGEAAARLVNLACLALLASLVYTLTRRHVSPAGALMAVALLLSTPVAYLVTGSLFVENVWTLFLMAAIGAVESWYRNCDKRWLWIGAGLAGSAAAGKFGALVCLFGLGFGLALALWRKKLPAGGVLVAGAVFLLFAAVPYVNAIARTGNPVFPYFNDFFRSPLFDSTQAFRDGRFPGYLKPDLLYQAVFNSSRFLESQDGAAGFHLFVLWPVALLALRRRMPFWVTVSTVSAPLILLLEFAGLACLRYLYPVMVLIPILAGWLLAEGQAGGRALGRAIAAAGWLCVAANTWLLGAASWQNRDFALNLAFDPASRHRFLAEAAPVRPVVEYLNKTIPGQPVAFMNINTTAELKGRAYTDTWHTPGFDEMLKQAGSALELWNDLRRLGISRVVAQAEGRDLRIRHVMARVIADECGEKLWQQGGLAVLRLREDCGAVLARGYASVLPPGEYDDRSEDIDYAGDWQTGDGFRGAAGGTLTYGDKAGLAFELRFDGSAVAWVFTRAYNRGLARVSIDGRESAIVNLYSSEIEWRREKRFPTVGPGPHVLRVEILGRKIPASTGTAIDIDLLRVER